MISLTDCIIAFTSFALYQWHLIYTTCNNTDYNEILRIYLLFLLHFTHYLRAWERAPGVEVNVAGIFWRPVWPLPDVSLLAETASGWRL